MKIIKFLLVVTLLASCDKIPDKIVDSNPDNYKIIALEVPSELVLLNRTEQVSLNYNIKIENYSAINKVYSNIHFKDNQAQVFSDILLSDNGDKVNSGDQKANDGIFSAKIAFDSTQNSGEYYIDFYVESINSITKKVAVKSFRYDNGENNLPPVISSLSIPDSIDRDVSFVFSVKASDPNGLNQIKKVYFQLFRPDGSQVMGGNNDPHILMVDDGNKDVFGDLIANDGIYSFKNSFAITAQTGVWTFKFRAEDYPGLLSNEIIHHMVVN